MSEPLDTAATCADCRAHDGWAAWCDECHVLARDEIERLRAENADLAVIIDRLRIADDVYRHMEQRAMEAEREWSKAEAKLAAVARVRDWMGENNDDAEYDLAIVALNNILEGGGRG